VVRVTDSGNLIDEATLILSVTPALPLVAMMELVGGGFRLKWSGGIPPYQVQTNSGLDSRGWANFGLPVSTNAVIIFPTNTANYFRIRLN
jgi:hypothetical protein